MRALCEERLRLRRMLCTVGAVGQSLGSRQKHALDIFLHVAEQLLAVHRLLQAGLRPPKVALELEEQLPVPLHGDQLGL